MVVFLLLFLVCKSCNFGSNCSRSCEYPLLEMVVSKSEEECDFSNGCSSKCSVKEINSYIKSESDKLEKTHDRFLWKRKKADNTDKFCAWEEANWGVYCR